MIPRYDIEYSLRREAQERAAALRSTCMRSRDAHSELADRYADRAWGDREDRCSAEHPC